MSKAVLISIRPKWCELIASGEKTIEIRKTRPKIETPFKCYIYCTKDPGNKGSATHFFESDEGTFYSAGKTFAAFLSGTVIGEFVCDEIQWNGGSSLIVKEDREYATRGSCVSREELFDYLGIVPGMSAYDKKCEFYGWHISDLVLYNEPKKLSDFKSYNTLIDFECGYPMPTHGIRRPPLSWMYVEELT